MTFFRFRFRCVTWLLATLSAVIGLLVAGCGSEPPAAPSKPNILFVAIDDLNDWVGPLDGHPQVQTPHMDRLAARGTTFLNAHTQAPLCNPSRTSLMTGRRPSTTGVYGLRPWFREVAELSELVTMPQYFEQKRLQHFFYRQDLPRTLRAGRH